MTASDDWSAVLCLQDQADLIAAVPYLLGYPPEGSLVTLAIATHASGRARLIFLARVGLPTRTTRASTVRRITELLVDRAADATIFIAYGRLPEGTWAELLPACRTAGIEIRDALEVQRGRWWSVLCADPDCCPPDGTPVLAPTEPGGPSQVAAVCVLAGLAVRPRPDR